MKLRILLMTSVGICAFSANSFAADDATSTAAKDTRSTIEEVIVTSRRRAENLQKVPDAVTAFSASDLESADITNIEGVLEITPNVEIRNDQQPGVFTINIRGVSQVRNGQAPVAFVIDGMTLPGRNFMTMDLIDIERIEVLKGPQGALYGRNSIGGAINVTTKKPTNDFEGLVKVRAANGDDYRIIGTLSGPIVEDKLLFRITGFYHESEGLLNNVFLGTNPDFEQTKQINGKLLFTPSDNVTVDVRASYHKSDTGCCYYRTTEQAFFPLAGNLVALDNTIGEISLSIETTSFVEATQVSMKVDWDTDYGTLTSVSAYQEIQESARFDLDWSGSSVLEGVDDGLFTDVDSIMQELRFTSPGDGDERFRWHIGAFYQKINRIRKGSNGINLTALLTGNADPAAKFIIPLPAIDFDIDWTSYAFFGQVNYDVTEKLELTLALRYDVWEDNTFQKAPSGLTFKDKYTDLQPKMSLAYSVNDDLMTYFTVSRGWRPGGFSDVNSITDTFSEESLWNYEVGLKSTFFDNRLRINGATFYIDYSDPQFFLLGTNPGGGPVQVIFNGEKASMYGFDLEVLAMTPIEGFEISAGFGLIEAKIGTPGSVLAASFPSVVSGNRLPNIANYTLNIAAQYERPVTDTIDFVGRIDFKRTGETVWTLDNIDKEPGFTIVDVRASLMTENWKISAFVENLFNEDYAVFGFDRTWSGFTADIEWPSRPRFYGVEMSYNF